MLADYEGFKNTSLFKFTFVACYVCLTYNPPAKTDMTMNLWLRAVSIIEGPGYFETRNRTFAWLCTHELFKSWGALKVEFYGRYGYN